MAGFFKEGTGKGVCRMTERYRILRTTNSLFTIERFHQGVWHVLPELRGGCFFTNADDAQVWLSQWSK